MPLAISKRETLCLFLFCISLYQYLNAIHMHYQYTLTSETREQRAESREQRAKTIDYRL